MRRISLWERFKRTDFISYWPDALGVLLLVLGLMGEIPGPIPYPPIPNLAKIHQDLSNDLIAIGITVLIIDNANKWTTDRIAKREEKKRLILQMGSPDHGFAIEAVRQLRERCWLYDGSLRGADLSEADLTGAKLSDAYLSGAKLKGAILSKAKLERADLSEADLTGAKLSDAYLSGAKLKGAILYEADLRGADLFRADLSEADLIRAKLFRADLYEADLRGADLEGANLIEAKGLTKDQIKSVESLRGAIMPDGSIYKPLNEQPDESGATPATPGA